MTIEIRNLCKSFKDVKAVQNVNLIVESGESVALLGPNGAGKTTLVEMIEGVQYPDSGEIHILDSCLLYTSPSPRDGLLSRMQSSA